jgi:hypothetical protein
MVVGGRREVAICRESVELCAEISAEQRVGREPPPPPEC